MIEHNHKLFIAKFNAVIKTALGSDMVKYVSIPDKELAIKIYESKNHLVENLEKYDGGRI